MGAELLRQETYLPDGEVARVYDFIEAHESKVRGSVRPRYFLSGSGGDDRVELPVEIYRILHQVVEALQGGLAVTVVPKTMTLTTQDAAELLGVSRPTLIKLLDEGKIPYERTGTHRRILLRDLLAYRERRRAEQYAALEATAVDLDDEEEAEVMVRRLREARRAVAAHRRQYRS
jgi:excisionase family DNA binding protein